MTRQAKEYDDIPGTTVFDAERSRQGYHLNQFCMSLMKPEGRAAFKENQEEYLKRWPMTAEQREAVMQRDYNRMLELGGNIYFLAKIFSTDGRSFQFAAATMTGMTYDEYVQMMVNGGRSIEGNRYKDEQSNKVNH